MIQSDNSVGTIILAISDKESNVFFHSVCPFEIVEYKLTKIIIATINNNPMHLKTVKMA